MSRIAVFGLWHLGSVTAACLADQNDVIGVDPDPHTVDQLQRGQPPVGEPGLAALMVQCSQRLRFTTDLADAARSSDIIWITFDTPVNEDDVADVEFVLNKMRSAVEHAKPGTVIVVSSQMPVGSVGKIRAEAEERYPGKNLHFACVPENLRLGKAIQLFTKADRYVIGADTDHGKTTLEAILGAYTRNVIHVSVESAEMSKHALNCFLALCVGYSNELARFCEVTGADAVEVERCLKSDARIGPYAYLSPGSAFSGGTLARDTVFLSSLSKRRDLNLGIVEAILPSNQRHKHWPVVCLKDIFGELKGRRIAVLGLTYKEGTDTLRRSWSLDVCEELHRSGAEVSAYDPSVSKLPDAHSFVKVCGSAEDAMSGCDAVILITPWPEFRDLGPNVFSRHLARSVVLDPAGFLRSQMSTAKDLEYYTVGVHKRRDS